MTLVIDVSPEVETRLQQAAARQGLPVAEYARAVLERQVLPLAVRVAALPPEEQDRALAGAAADAADLYDADLALPPGERELTDFTALDGEPTGDSGRQLARRDGECYRHRDRPVR